MRHTKRGLELSTVVLAGLLLVSCGSNSGITGPGGGTPTPATTPTPGIPATQVTISGFAFSALTVPVGTAVTWKNSDSTAHTATADPSSAFQFDTGSIDPGATSKAIVFSSAGSFPYHCSFHTTMRATIVVQ
jgi:plastocyanin